MKMSKTLGVIVLVALVASLALGSVAYNYVDSQAFNRGTAFGYLKGREITLNDMDSFLKSGGFTFNWMPNSDGSYNVTLMGINKQGNFFVSTGAINAATFNALNGTFSHVPPKVTTNVDYKFQIAEGAGVREIIGSSGNIITDLGVGLLQNITGGVPLANWWAGNTTSYYSWQNATRYIGLGNVSNTATAYRDNFTSQAAGATQNSTYKSLGNYDCGGTTYDGGFQRFNVTTPTYASGSGIGNGYYYNVTVTKTFTATVADTVNGTTLYTSDYTSLAPSLFAEANIGTLPIGQAFAINDNCTITWTITYQH